MKLSLHAFLPYLSSPVPALDPDESDTDSGVEEDPVLITPSRDRRVPFRSNYEIDVGNRREPLRRKDIEYEYEEEPLEDMVEPLPASRTYESRKHKEQSNDTNTAQVAYLNGIINSLKRSLHEQSRILSNSHSLLSSKENKIHHLRTQLDSKDKEILSKDKLITRLRITLDERSREVRGLEDDLDREQVGHAETAARLSDTEKGRKEDKMRMAREKERTNQEIARLNDLLASERQTHENRVRELESRVQEHVQTISRLEASNVNVNQAFSPSGFAHEQPLESPPPYARSIRPLPSTAVPILPGPSTSNNHDARNVIMNQPFSASGFAHERHLGNPPPYAPTIASVFRSPVQAQAQAITLVPSPSPFTPVPVSLSRPLRTGSEIKWRGYGCPQFTAVPECIATDGYHNFKGSGTNG
ncbi:hypothetical protein H0H93_006168, partial [Arthromyces matolae]